MNGMDRDKTSTRGTTGSDCQSESNDVSDLGAVRLVIVVMGVEVVVVGVKS